MLSSFLNLELMHNQQVGKEIIFNEAIIKMEQLCSQLVIKFISHPYKDLKKGLYIIDKNSDKYHNHLTFFIADRWRYIKPQENMMIFIEEKNAFFKFSEDGWKIVELAGQEHAAVKAGPSKVTSSEAKTLTYTAIKDKYIIPNEQDFLHFYLNGNANIEIKAHNSSKITLLIKQNHQRKFKMTWSGNIVFEKDPPELEENNLIVMHLYKTPEDDRYLVGIVGIYA
jgi:hypothetical protein